MYSDSAVFLNISSVRNLKNPPYYVVCVFFCKEMYCIVQLGYFMIKYKSGYDCCFFYGGFFLYKRDELLVCLHCWCEFLWFIREFI